MGVVTTEGSLIDRARYAGVTSQLAAIATHNDYKTYGYNMLSGLRAYRAACADIDRNPLKVAVIGTSISAGTYASDFIRTSYISRIRAALQAKYGNVGQGNYFVPGSMANTAMYPWWVFTGTWVASGANGIAARSMYSNTAGSTATLTFHGNAAHLFYSRAANGSTNGVSITIDGNPVTAPNFGVEVGYGNIVSYTGLSNADHVMVITAASDGKYCYIEDVVVDNPLASAPHGCYVYNFGRGSGTAAMFYNTRAKYTAFPIGAHLVIIELGVNDTSYPVTFRTNLGSLVSSIKSNAKTSVMLLSMYDWSTTEATLAAMATNRSHIYAVADQYDCAVLDVYSQWGTWAQADALGLWGVDYTGAEGHDYIHPSDKGHRVLASMILDKID